MEDYSVNVNLGRKGIRLSITSKHQLLVSVPTRSNELDSMSKQVLQLHENPFSHQ